LLHCGEVFVMSDESGEVAEGHASVDPAPEHDGDLSVIGQGPQFWCHHCHKEVQIRLSSHECAECGDGFVEEMTDTDNPSQWDQPLRLPFPGLRILAHGRNTLEPLRAQRTMSRDLDARQPTQPLPFDDDPNSQFLFFLAHLLSGRSENIDTLISRIMENDPNRFGSPPASEEAISSLETVTTTPNSSDVCPVCMDAICEESPAVKMPCNHLFHDGCLRPWLQQHNSCPSCRFELPTDDADYEQSREERRRAASAEQETRLREHSSPAATVSEPPRARSTSEASLATRRRLSSLFNRFRPQQ